MNATNAVKKHTQALQSLNTLTVGELKALLDNYDDETPVVLACSYGDRGNTQQVIEINHATTSCLLERSAYSLSGVAVADRELEEDDIVLVEDGEEEMAEGHVDPVLVLNG